MAKQENVEAVKRAADRFRARDLDGHLELYSSAVIHHGFSSRIRPGLTGLREHYNNLLKGFPDMRVDILDIIADGEKVVHRFSFHGTHKGEFLGVAPTAKAISAPGVHIHLFENGKCIEVWQVLDTFRFLSEMGAVPQLRELR
ncbi:MAG TPA: ester cyclase [Terriglobales bacterium]|nr:ester cyclase [Terriglobales bacterium]